MYAHEEVVQEYKASYLESVSLSQSPNAKQETKILPVGQYFRLCACTSMAADALTFHFQRYMDFVLIPGDKTALEDNLCVSVLYVCMCVRGDEGDPTILYEHILRVCFKM